MRTSTILRPSLLLLALGAALCAPAQTKYGFRVVDVSAGFDPASDLDDAGQTVGYMNTDDITQAFREVGGRPQGLGTLGGTYSSATRINGRGEVTGSSDLALESGEEYARSHAFLYANGTMRDLGTLGGGYSGGNGINERGQVTGSSYLTGDVTQHAFLYSDGTMRDIDTLGSATSAGYSINSFGTVVGYYAFNADDGSSRAFRYTQASGMVDIGTLGGEYASASDVNDRGQIVGFSSDASGRFRPFLFDGGTMTAITSSISGFVPQSARSINESGQIVGRAQAAGSLLGRAFLYTATSGTRDLNGLVDLTGTPYAGWTLYDAFTVNDSGQILVQAWNGNFNAIEARSFVLTPVPEPASMIALGLGALALVRRRKRA